MTSASLALILITLLAAVVNGALGYGFSSITVPVALLFYTNRVLNPALIWIEVALNAYVLWINRASTSFPVPVSPRRRIGRALAAAHRRLPSRARIPGSAVTQPRSSSDGVGSPVSSHSS